ncbi:DUF1610 domain-containing protein [Candidatus Woesearchaeota archaeon]|nr:DUF1610 domain-containing protein [Candidatus Woesearchaeota archaeon]
MTDLICNSCKVPIANQRGVVKFKCPNCGDFVIIRCKHCRELGSKYLCQKCGFSGPN